MQEHRSVRIAIVAALAAIAALGGKAMASGPGGGGGGIAAAPLNIAGTWRGEISLPNPSQLLQGVLTLSEDAAGNIAGQLSFGPSFAVDFVSGTAKADSYQLKVEGALLTGSGIGSITCLDGSAGAVLAGSVQERGATSFFSFNNCP